MRVIKFRAWCEGTHGNVTFSNPHMDYDVVLVDGKYACVEGSDIHGSYESIPLMQYTGVHDAKGRDIYEGDILLIPHEIIADSIDGYNRYEPENLIQSVYFHDGKFCTAFDDLSNLDQYCEVIGNIYENPELLPTHPTSEISD